MQDTRVAFSAGQQVVCRAERWVIVSSERFPATSVLTLRGAGRANRDERQYALTACDTVVPIGAPTRLRQRSRRRTLSRVTAAILRAMPWDQCWTAVTANIELHAWQLEPARSALRGAMRILLADAVGLGKTIQAGLIVSELRARGLADRVLVLTPASLREQWAEELTSRFALQPVVFDQTTIAAASLRVPADVNPWSIEPLIISSIDLVKRPEVRSAIDGTAFDVLVVDEAHHLNPGTDRSAVVVDLANRTPWVVLVSATPHRGDDNAYEHLRSIGAHPDAPVTVFRRTRSVQTHLQRRRSRTLYVASSRAERALFREIAAYSRALARCRTSAGAQLLGSVIARRAASSSIAVGRTLSRRIALLEKKAPAEHQPFLPWEDESDRADELSDAAVGVRGLDDVEAEVAWLQRLCALADRAGAAPTKLGAIRRLLRRTSESLLIFSEYRDVVLEVAAALGAYATVGTLHGGMSPRQRRDVVRSFVAGALRVLVATDAAGEGLNLQAGCRLVVNLELPWMPLRLEQRIGRVDRLGQSRTVHAIQLAHRGSYEGTVVARLLRRRASASNLAAAPVVSDSPPERRIRRLVDRSMCQKYSEDDGVYSARGRRRATTSVTLVFAVPLSDAAGALVHTALIPLRLRGNRRRLSRSMLRELLKESLLRGLLQRAAEVAARDAQQRTARTGAVLEQRLSWIRTRLASHRGTQWQGALFDRRDEHRVRRRESTLAALDAQLARRAEQGRALQQLHGGSPRLVAAWLSGN